MLTPEMQAILEESVNISIVKAFADYNQIPNMTQTLLAELYDVHGIKKMALLLNSSERTIKRLLLGISRGPVFCVRYKIFLLHLLTFRERYLAIIHDKEPLPTREKP